MRAVLAAQAILTALRENGLSCAIGISTGRVFCGVVGNELRREYTVMGNPVNLSARLMQEAMKTENGHPIVMDKFTAEEVDHQLQLEPLGALQLKGKAHSVLAFRCIGGLHNNLLHTAQANNPVQRCIGRQAEIAQLATFNKQHPHACLLACDGLPGMGRKTILSALRTDARALSHTCDPVQEFTPWQACAGIVRQLFQINELTTPELCTHAIYSALPENMDILQRAPLFGARTARCVARQRIHRRPPAAPRAPRNRQTDWWVF
ncbi:MAG: adenylate/guanylate cyclase domain-containing protein [Limnobacter sp.]|nr:adenylate/guanylate cyclase domain-containing protein [Limnobacter sp.]